MILFAQISDLHLDGGGRAWDRAVRTVRSLRAFGDSLAAVVVTGDLADHGTAGEYREVAEVLDLPCPVLMCPGNHDVRGPYREVLLGQPPADEPINSVHDISGLRFVMCDSSIPGRDDGYLTDETLAWLDDVLADTTGPALVCFHHPPVQLHHPFIDGIRQFGADRLEAVLNRHRHTVAVLCGHAHTPAATTFADRQLVVAPGVVSTLGLPFEKELLRLDQPPAFAVHMLGDDGRLVTRFQIVS